MANRNADHWAWDIPTEEFYPLGREKLELLIKYICLTEWASEVKKHKPQKVIDDVTHDRKYASKLYTVYKQDILEMQEQEIKDAEEDARKEKVRIKENAKKINPRKNEIAKVISFVDFKKKMA